MCLVQEEEDMEYGKKMIFLHFESRTTFFDTFKECDFHRRALLREYRGWKRDFDIKIIDIFLLCGVDVENTFAKYRR